MNGKKVFVAGAVRTPIGKFGGGLAGVPAAELGAIAARAALTRAGVPASAVEQVVFGHARQAGNGPNLARQVVRATGLDDRVPAFTINMACASGLMSVVEAARAVALGEAGCVLAGGAENMSQIPFLYPDGRWGKKLGDQRLVDAMYRDGYLCPLCGQVMGETAETLVAEYGITRAEQDEYALASQRRAAAAWADGRFAEEVAPVVVRDQKGRETKIEQDEHPRADTSLEGLAKLPPVFKKEGSVHAGNSSAITDGGAAMLVLSEDQAERLGARVQARLVDAVAVGVDPARMGIGPVPAVEKLLSRNLLNLTEIDLVELNEAFAAQVIACDRELHFDRARLNVNGGAIALGHPTGCSGTRIAVTLLAELSRRKGRYGIATLCVSGGQGVAVLFERLGR
ncbi:MAG TPA: thiolase family protein [Candidatus Eisenbacteria bacterium]|nr:thiolase family protein [Candidatus Eisenbacteria bacterium]